MNLLFCIDRKFVKHLVNCLNSILENGGAEHYDIFILHSDLNEDDIYLIRSMTSESISCQFIPIDPNIFEDFPESSRYPQQIYYRIISPLLLPESIDRILYLDVDTTVINPLNELYESDFDNAAILACSHVRNALTKFNQLRLRIDKDVPYINSGVMLMNLPILRELLNVSDIKEFVRQRQYSLFLPDQDILTALYGDKIQLIDSFKYNMCENLLLFNNVSPANKKIDINWIRDNTVIIHYCGRSKPWNEHYIGVLNVFYKDQFNSYCTV